MHKITTFNKIAPVGLKRLGEDYTVAAGDLSQSEGIIVRSQALHDIEFEPSLLGIARAGAGTNNIPVDRCAEAGIVVFNTPGANAQSVAELTVGALFATARHIPAANAWAKTLTDNVAKQVEDGKKHFAGTELAGKTIGIIGLGAIGTIVANTTDVLGMNVVAYVRTPRKVPKLHKSVRMTCDLDEVLAAADYISVHVPMNDANKGLIGDENIAKMKDGAVVLNFSRGGLVDDAAMIGALNEGKLSAYVTDFPNDALVGCENVFLIPHLGASTEESEDRCAIMAADEIRDYIENGNIVNSVNFPGCARGEIPQEADARICLLGNDLAALQELAEKTVAGMGGEVLGKTAADSKGRAVYLADVKGVSTDALSDSLNNNSTVLRARIIEPEK